MQSCIAENCGSCQAYSLGKDAAARRRWVGRRGKAVISLRHGDLPLSWVRASSVRPTPSGPACAFKPSMVTMVAMAKSISRTKRSSHSHTTRTGRQIGERWHEDELAAIDNWRRTQEDLPSQAEAIRRLVEIGLTAYPSSPGSTPAKRRGDAGRTLSARKIG